MRKAFQNPEQKTSEPCTVLPNQGVPPGPLQIKCKSHKFSEISSGFSKNKTNNEEWDIYDTAKRYNALLEDIPNWDTSPDNRAKILWFLKRLETEQISVIQRHKYIYSFRHFLRVVNKDFDDLTEEDMEDFLISLKGYSLSSKNTRWVTIKKFLRYIGKEEITKNIKVSFKGKGTVLPQQLLTEDDVKGMVDAARGIRNKAFIHVLYESGARIGEMLSLRIKHVIFDNLGCKLMLSGKTGMRQVRIIQSVPALANWVENHPGRDDPDGFLWCHHYDHSEPIRYGLVNKVLRQAGRAAGIKKKINPHNFRHSRATILAENMSEQMLKVYFGWSGSSRMVEVYTHLTASDAEKKILEINGIKKRDSSEASALRSVKCPRCGRSNHSASKTCNRCGMLLDMTKAFGLEKKAGNDGEFSEFLMDMFRKWKEGKG